MNFAFYGRVSTEDQQDPTSSKAWQRSRSESLIEPHGGVVVADFFDVGTSRSLPWKRRPEAASLLESFKRQDRGFEAVVIGEPARAFYGNQFGLTFPVFVHYGIELWVPEVGGRVDPGSDAHDLVMSLYGGMSKGERNRIKIRVRSAQASQVVTEGRYQGGRPPYGYQLADAGPHPNPAKAADGKRLRRLELDPVAAPIVRRIFGEYLSGSGLYAIAEGLTRDGVPSPSGHDPTRNRHRQASCGAWSKSAIRAILRNPRYTGRQVWGRQPKHEELVDVEDVALGHVTKQRWADSADWLWSAHVVHEPIIDADTFARAQSLAAAAATSTNRERRRSTSASRYVLAGLVRCGLCGRKMQGSRSHGRAHYRCRFASEYAARVGLEHPKQLYIREDRILPELDAWIARVFADVDAAAEALAAAHTPDEGAAARSQAARRKIADCEARLAKYRAALDAGGDPVVVAGWMREVTEERATAERLLIDAGTPAADLTIADVRAMLASIGDYATMIDNAEPELKARLYRELGLTLTYEPDRHVVVVEAHPWTLERVEGGT